MATEPETIEERMLLVEYKQEQHEARLEDMNTKLCEVELAVASTHEMIVQTNGLVNAMPSTIREVIREEADKKKLNLREVATLILLFVATLASIAGLLK